jgi:flagellar protein FliO/FliZ
MIVRTLVAVLSTALTSVAFAADQPFAAPQAASPVTSTGTGGLAQVTLSLMLVLAAIFAAAWVVRRLRNFGRPGAGAIQVVADIALGTKERAVLIQVGEQQLLIGVAPGRVNTLHVLAEPVKGVSKDEVSSSPANAPDFKSILKRSLGL